MTQQHAKRVNYEYKLAGTASIFKFAEPLVQWRSVSVRERRTKVDWAIEMKALLTTRYASAEKIILVRDNLNTQTLGSFYEAFPAVEAYELFRRIKFQYTPKHGSWLNIAENELSSMTRQCMQGRRFATIDELTQKRWRGRMQPVTANEA